MEEHKDRPDKFYNTFKPFISNKGKGSSAIHLKTKENNMKKNQSEVAEMLARHFTNAALNIGGDHVSRLTEEDHREHDSVKSIQEAYEENYFDFKLLMPNEEQWALGNINPKKSSGWYSGVSLKLLKNVAKGTAISVMNLYNHCIEKSKRLALWKVGEQSPVVKRADRQDAKNYHPVTSLIAVNKIFEQLFSHQITCHYDKTLFLKMTAYIKPLSCETTLLGLIEDWKQVVNSKQLVYILSTDMSKAFNCLSHCDNKEVGGLWLWKWISLFDTIVFQKQTKR